MTADLRCADPNRSSPKSPPARTVDVGGPPCQAGADAERRPVPLALVRDGVPPLPTIPPVPPKIGLSEFERRAVTGLVSGPGEDMERYAAERAAGYATGDAEVRRRAVARAAAVQDAFAQELTALLAAAVGRRDTAGAILIDRALNSANLRYLRLLEALRVESAPSRRVVIRATGAISVLAEEQT